MSNKMALLDELRTAWSGDHGHIRNNSRKAFLVLCTVSTAKTLNPHYFLLLACGRNAEAS